MLIKQGKTNWKYILIVAVITAIVGGGILYYQWQMEGEVIKIPELKIPEKITKDETANWQTYQNEECGFEMKYPTNWNYGPNILRELACHLVFCPPEFSDFESDFGCKWVFEEGKVPTSPAPIFLFVEDWDDLKGETKEEKKRIDWCELEEKKVINGIEAEFLNCEGQKRIFWEDPAGTHLYKLLLMDSNFSNEFYQMFSTFRFLD